MIFRRVLSVFGDGSSYALDTIARMLKLACKDAALYLKQPGSSDMSAHRTAAAANDHMPLGKGSVG